jgi:NADH:ubiquinone oxidoreductase subunit E
MVAITPLVSEFTIVGKLENAIANSKGYIKHIYLSTPEEDYLIEIAKPKNISVSNLPLGCWLEARGMRKYELHQDRVKYKAYRIELLRTSSEKPATSKPTTTANTKAKVLICQGSSCWKNGAKAACESLQSELQAKGISDRVELKSTECLKQCKQAPNLIILPGRIRCSRVQPKQVSKLVARHLL